jgi:hypothetical protein
MLSYWPSVNDCVNQKTWIRNFFSLMALNGCWRLLSRTHFGWYTHCKDNSDDDDDDDNNNNNTNEEEFTYVALN